MLLFLQPFVIKASAKKRVLSFFDVKTAARAPHCAATAATHDQWRHDEQHVGGLDHYIDSRFSGELFRID